MADLLWIVGIYAAAAAMAHGVFGRSSGAGKRHYVLVAGNHQMQIEWYLRALRRFSRRTGTDIGITVVLRNSTDETGSILEKFSSGDDRIGWVRGGVEWGLAAGSDIQERPDPGDGTEGTAAEAAMAADPQVIWVDLNKREDLARLPL
jgi:hypothetical protein